MKNGITVEKVIRNGKVAVLYSPSYGAGWYTKHDREALVFHPTIVAMVEAEKQYEITEELLGELLGEDPITTHISNAGAYDLAIEWVDEGVVFQILEYDGNESIQIITGNDELLTA